MIDLFVMTRMTWSFTWVFFPGIYGTECSGLQLGVDTKGHPFNPGFFPLSYPSFPPPFFYHFHAALISERLCFTNALSLSLLSSSLLSSLFSLLRLRTWKRIKTREISRDIVARDSTVAASSRLVASNKTSICGTKQLNSAGLLN